MADRTTTHIFFFTSKNCQPLFPVELTEARQEPVLFQKEVACICMLAVTALSSNAFQAIEILSINHFRHILFLASPPFLYNETPNVRVPEKKKSNTKLCIIIAPLRTTVVCYKVWQVCTKTKGLSPWHIHYFPLLSNCITCPLRILYASTEM